MNRNAKIAIGVAAVAGILFFAKRASAAEVPGAAAAPAAAPVLGSGGAGLFAPPVLGMSNPTLPQVAAPAPAGPTSVLPNLSSLFDAIFHASPAPAPAPAIVAAPMPAPAPAPVVHAVANTQAPAPAPYTAPAQVLWQQPVVAPAPSPYVNNTWVADGNGGFLHGGD